MVQGASSILTQLQMEGILVVLALHPLLVMTPAVVMALPPLTMAPRLRLTLLALALAH